MAESGVKEAALRLRELADRCRIDEHAEHVAPLQAPADAAIELRLAEQAAAIAELSRQVVELSQLIRASAFATPREAAVNSHNHTGRQTLLFLTAGMAALGMVGWAWEREDFGAIVDQALRLAGAVVGS